MKHLLSFLTLIKGLFFNVLLINFLLQACTKDVDKSLMNSGDDGENLFGGKGFGNQSEEIESNKNPSRIQIQQQSEEFPDFIDNSEEMEEEENKYRYLYQREIERNSANRISVDDLYKRIKNSQNYLLFQDQLCVQSRLAYSAGIKTCQSKSLNSVAWIAA